MNKARRFQLLAVILLFLMPAGALADDAPRVFQCDGEQLAAAHQKAVANDPSMAPILKSLREHADKLITDGPYTIVNKKKPLPGVDPHDYVSLAPYFWPDPTKPDGLPYIRKDGVHNPDTNDYDAKPFSDFSDHVWNLALAGYMTGDARYSDRAALLIRAWFFDPQTRMNPNLDHAQFIRGVNTGRGTGVLESTRFLNVIDGVGLLQKSKSWTSDDQAAFVQWFQEYLKWIQESKNGQAEGAATNNHGSWYDVQVTVYMLFLGDNDGARKIMETAKEKRIAAQIQPNGDEPREFARTKSWGYSCFNLKALSELADLGRRVNVDLWGYQTSDGRSIKAVLDNLLPYALGQKPWTHEQIVPFEAKEMLIPLRRAAYGLKDVKYEEAIGHLKGVTDVDKISAMGFPAPEPQE